MVIVDDPVLLTPPSSDWSLLFQVYVEVLHSLQTSWMRGEFPQQYSPQIPARELQTESVSSKMQQDKNIGNKLSCGNGGLNLFCNCLCMLPLSMDCDISSSDLALGGQLDTCAT